MIIKTKFMYILLFMFMLCSCNTSTLKDIAPQGGIYIYKKNKSPVNGNIVDYFKNGKISCELNFKNGIPVGEYKSYGYQGEIVATSKYSTIIKNEDDFWKKNGIVRLTLSNSVEGDHDIKNETTDLFVVFKQQSISNYPDLVQQSLTMLETNKFDSNKIEKIYFCLGEFEPAFYEIKMSSIKK